MQNQDATSIKIHNSEIHENKSTTSKSSNKLSGFYSQLKLWLIRIFTGVVEWAALLMLTATLNSYLIHQNMMLDNICQVRIKLPPSICKEIVNA
jgi:hypothetical protein